METYSEEIFNSLLKLSEINVARVEGYKNAISKICKGDMRKELSARVKETMDLSNQLNSVISDSKSDSETTKVDQIGKKILRPNFYFMIAKGSNNPRTAILSCQLGDQCAVTAYKELLITKTVKLLPFVRKILVKQLKNLEDSLVTTRLIMFDSSFVLN
jgi:hypothetical protein